METMLFPPLLASFIICMLVLPNMVDFLASNFSEMIQNMADFIKSIA